MLGNSGLYFAMILAAVSGLPGLFCSRRSSFGQWIATGLMLASGLCGLIGLAQTFGGGPILIAEFPSPFPNATFSLSVDSLSGFFLVPVFLVSVLGSIYGLEYWKQSDHLENGRKLHLFYGLLAAFLMVVMTARNSVSFLFGWEGMAVSAFFLVGTEDERDDVREAAWLYLAASHAATLSLFTLFALMYGLTGTFDFIPLTAERVSPVLASTLFVLALGGFGLKAGLMPLHFWLPSAHAMAPSHVSAIMSGVLIKTGIYGLIRMTGLLPEPPLWWGGLMIALGSITAVLGIVYALSQHDLKRLLAYSSIENIGIISIGLGLALVGRTLHSPLWVVLGLSGALLHVWNHALFKSLLFFGSGAVIHATGMREIDGMGGLAKRMPWTAGAILIGAMAASGLPPCNGFISEFLIYLGLFHTVGLPGEAALPAAVFAIPALALAGAAAVACFVKVYGIIFLGTPRRPLTHQPHEPGWPIRLPLGVLAAFALLLGVAPVIAVPLLDNICTHWGGVSGHGTESLAAAAPLATLTWIMISLITTIIVACGVLQWRIRSQPYSETETWGCGYLAPTPRLQYTGTSLSQFLVSIFDWSLRPIEHRPNIQELFPQSAEYHSSVPELVLDRVVSPVFRFVGRGLLWFRLLQQGSVQIYLLYILAILVLLFLAF